MNIMMYGSLKSLLELKLGPSAHLEVKEMLMIREHCDSIQALYVQFKQFLKSAAEFKMEKDMEELRKEQNEKPVVKAKTEESPAYPQEVTESLLNKKETPSDVDESRQDQKVPEGNIAKDVKEQQKEVELLKEDSLPAYDSSSEQQQVLTEKVPVTQPLPIQTSNNSEFYSHLFFSIYFISFFLFSSSFFFFFFLIRRFSHGHTDSSSALADLLAQSLQLHQRLVDKVQSVQSLIDRYKQSIDPQRIILANSEYGAVQRYYVHPKYKEMVKGCGCVRSQYHAMWAGIQQPGDGWMNELLKCYWREHDDVPFKPSSLKPEHTTRPRSEQSLSSAHENEILRQLDVMSARVQNPQVLDVISMEELLVWMRTVRQCPFMYSSSSREAVEVAAEKMGGWEDMELFCRNWIRQFYLQTGRSGIPYPLPGCKAWFPQSSTTGDGTFSHSPLSISIRTLSQLPVEEVPPLEPAVPFDSTKWMPSPTHDQKWWDYLWFCACKELLDLYDVLEKELEGGSSGLQKWMDLVRRSGLLENGDYVDLLPDPNSTFDHDESLSKQQRKRLHPLLIRIREKAIVVNACLKPDRLQSLRHLESEIRREFVPTLKEFISGTLQSTQQLPSSSAQGPLLSPQPLKKEPPSVRKTKSHRKSLSTGVVERASKFFQQRQQEEQHEAAEVKEDVNASYPQPLATDSKEVSRRERSHSVPQLPADALPGGHSFHFHLETQRICREILAKPGLPDATLVQAAFTLSEVVVKHYLIHELPAKYQSVY